MKIYLAGPMRGLPEFNHPAFHDAAQLLRSAGHEVFSPAEADIATYGCKGDANGCEEQAAKDYGYSRRKMLGIDLAWICAHAEAIALLPGWEKSKGATAEKTTADALGLKIIDLVNF